MCLFPRIIRNKKYIENKKNGGNIPPVFDERVLYVPMACGECIECRNRKAREWMARLMEEIRSDRSGIFVTMTFSNESIEKLTDYIGSKNEGLLPNGYELDNEIATVGVRLFLERWRKLWGVSIKHWMITELGHNGTENIHMHGIIWKEGIDNFSVMLEEVWKYGFIWSGYRDYENYVNEATVNYITKYVTKMDFKHKGFKGKILCSDGIGKEYSKSEECKLGRYECGKTKEYYRLKNGNKINIPIYWRNKMYSEEEREKLWIEKLNKNERYVLGQKINVNEGDEEYKKILKVAQNKNNRLGYGDGVKNWKEEEYYNEIRNIKNMERIKRAQKNK